MKAVIFDFDGTIAKSKENIWKNIFMLLGYDASGENCEYKTQYRNFLSGKINYQQWCDQTRDCYKVKGFSKDMFYTLAEDIKVLPGVENVFKTLHNKGIKICIVSGNFVEIIQQVLADLKKYVYIISANTIEFDDNNIISKISGTKYDFYGKAKFIEDFCNANKINAKDILFVGNSDNDEWAYMSGCITLCVNPDKTDCKDNKKWHYYIENMKSLEEILPYVKK